MSNTHININSTFIKKYVKHMTKIMMKTNPNWDKKDIENCIYEMIKEQAMNPRVEMDNNYTHENKDTTLISLFDWILDRKPIIAGNGTFYKNQNEALNPIRLMLDEWADSRKKFKKEMFAAGEELGFDSYEYQTLDRKQNNEKINMNSWYGGSGAPTAAFYSKWSGPATTLTAQSVISTAETMFESFLADNYIYLDITELIEWIDTVIKEDVEIDDFIKRKNADDVYDRLFNKILNKEEYTSEILAQYLSTMTSSQLTSLYYKNNMIEFINDHKEIQNIIISIFSSVENLDYIDNNDSNWIENIPKKFRDSFKNKTVDAWNKFVDKAYFMDPNSPPKTIEDELVVLSEYLIKYCYVEYLSMDRIYRLRNFNRNVVTVIDTDSNFLSLDTLINFIFDNVVKDMNFGRDDEHNSFIIVNTITYTITKAIRKMFDYYGECANIPEDYRGRFDMKNEFFNSLLVIGKTKKRYISKQKLREGNLLTKPKSDIKGFDFKKATTSEYAENVFMRLIQDHILNSEEVELKEMIKGIQAFREEIKTSIENGERGFLPNGNVKEIAAYKDPGTSQSIRGAITWNLLYPDNTIEAPAKVSLLKMNIFNESDIEDLKYTHPDIYNIIIDKIFNDTTGIFVTKTKDPGIDYVNIKKKNWYDDIPKKYRPKYKKLGPVEWNSFVDEVLNDTTGKYDSMKKDNWIYKKKGLQVLAIPSNSNIPEWTQPYIDYSTMINNITAPFEPVLEIFGVRFTKEGKTHDGVNRKTNAITNIIKF